MTYGKTMSFVWTWMKKDYLKDFKFDTYWKKKKRETKNKMERRRTESCERTWSTR
jgi:hypothetical protein